MKILLTGGCGFIGSNLIRHLITDTDHHVINLDKLTYAGNASSLADLANHDRYQLIQADIGDAAQMDKVFADFAPDSVMHLAAESHVDRSIDGPADFIQTNIVGTFNLLQSSITEISKVIEEIGSDSCMFQRMKFTVHLAKQECSQRQRLMIRTRLIPPPRLRRTIWPVPGKPRLAYRS